MRRVTIVSLFCLPVLLISLLCAGIPQAQAQDETEAWLKYRRCFTYVHSMGLDQAIGVISADPNSGETDHAFRLIYDTMSLHFTTSLDFDIFKARSQVLRAATEAHQFGSTYYDWVCDQFGAPRPKPDVPYDSSQVEGWFSCKWCEVFAEGIGIAVMAACIAANPEGTAAMVAYKTIYAAYTDKYGHHMDLDEFISRSKTFVSFGSAAWFVIHYPRFVCCLFGKCSCDSNCSCD